jgi:hypothetical protein
MSCEQELDGNKSGFLFTARAPTLKASKKNVSSAISKSLAAFNKSAFRGSSADTDKHQIFNWNLGYDGQAHFNPLLKGDMRSGGATHGSSTGATTTHQTNERGGWSNLIPGIYIHSTVLSDRCSARSITGLPLHIPMYALLAVHFHGNLDSILAAAGWTIGMFFPNYENRDSNFKPMCPYLLASGVYHQLWLEKQMPANHRLRKSFFWRKKAWTVLLPHVDRHPNNLRHLADFIHGGFSLLARTTGAQARIDGLKARDTPLG